MDNISLKKIKSEHHLLLSHLESHSVNIKAQYIPTCRQLLTRLYNDIIHRLTLIRMDFLKIVFFWGVNLPNTQPLRINQSNINITFYNC